jgi:hypothetical protein
VTWRRCTALFVALSGQLGTPTDSADTLRVRGLSGPHSLFGHVLLMGRILVLFELEPWSSPDYCHTYSECCPFSGFKFYEMLRKIARIGQEIGLQCMYFVFIFSDLIRTDGV